MASTFVPLSIAVIAAAAAGVALYFYRRASSLYALLVEGANRFEELRLRNQQLEYQQNKADERLKGLRESLLVAEREREKAQEHSDSLQKTLDTRELETRLAKERWELHRAHLERELAKFQNAANMLENKYHELQATLAQNEANAEEKLRQALAEQKASLQQRSSAQALAVEAQRQDLMLREREINLKLKDLEKEHDKVLKKVKDADPAEMRRLKRRIAQYDRLYSGMKGLREMSDERSKNYEVAITKMATWIARTHGIRPLPNELGPLLGAALEAIGVQLIDDHESKSETPRPAGGSVHYIPDEPESVASAESNAKSRGARGPRQGLTSDMDLHSLALATLGQSTGSSMAAGPLEAHEDETDLDAEEAALLAAHSEEQAGLATPEKYTTPKSEAENE